VVVAYPSPALESDVNFGFEGRPASPALAAYVLKSSIVGRFEGWQVNGRISLANGQFWQISDGSQATYELRDPMVRVTRGVAGTFFMAIDGVAQIPRVRRIR
jgi:hypothetical protein